MLASSSEDSSQASASSQSASGTRVGLDRVRIAIDQQDLVPVLDQLAGDGPADVAGSGDGDAHVSELLGSGGEDGLDVGRAARPRPRRRSGRRPGRRCRAWAPRPNRGGTRTGPSRRWRLRSARRCGRPRTGRRAPPSTGRSRTGPATAARSRRAAAGGAPGRRSSARWRRWGCPVARTPRRGPGRRCGPPRCGRRRSRAPPGRPGCWSCRRWRRRRTPRARSMPASESTSRSKPTPLMVWPSKSGPRRRNASVFWSMTATV